MECTEARALKASFLSQMAIKTTNSQLYYNDNADLWYAPNVSEEFHVEDLLNLDFSDVAGFYEEDGGFYKNGCDNSSSTFSGANEFHSLSTSELSVPIEGLESLEWLSQFVEDSTGGLSLMCPTGSLTADKIQATVPRKKRSKRLRSNGLQWSLLSPALSSVDSSSATSSSYGSSVPTLIFPPDTDWFYTAEKSPPPQKKPKRKSEPESSGRRCTHCLVQKTPQWRTGPSGPKTLCNACGVRFKSGRLFPEYRPACSPTFSLEVHSNSHRKVVEMRRRKQMAATTAVDDRNGFAPPALIAEVFD